MSIQSKSLHIIYLTHILREKINVHIICWNIYNWTLVFLGRVERIIR